MNTITLNSLSLIELKQLAKGRRIKQYYIMKRRQLIQLLSLPELPKTFVIDKLTILQLRQEAKAKGIRGFWNLSRDQMVELLYPNATTPLPQENHENSPDA